MKKEDLIRLKITRLTLLRKYQEANDKLPSYSKMRDIFGLKSKSSAYDYFNKYKNEL